ncbi:MAG: hypothetical protein FWC16_08100 [Defluviitaleaceae bacterium]|nr:hypothetical protein [Defluviitaleaceae bacterium]MCL2274874.1 hypothetical protein [Defluviitaleaceae bacterium]
MASKNLSASNSRIRDADMALEMMSFTQGVQKNFLTNHCTANILAKRQGIRFSRLIKNLGVLICRKSKTDILKKRKILF